MFHHVKNFLIVNSKASVLFNLAEMLSSEALIKHQGI